MNPFFRLCKGFVTCVAMFEIMNIFYVAVWATGILAALEGVSLLEDIQDIPELSKPPYHPDLIPASRLSAGITVFTEIWAGVLMVTTVVMFNSKSTTGYVAWWLSRTIGQIILIACYAPAIVMQRGYLPRPLNLSEGCKNRYSWPPGSGVDESRYPTMFSLIPGRTRKRSYWNSCERLIQLHNLEFAILGIVCFSTVVSIGLGLYLVFMDEDRQHTTAGSYPLENRDEYKVLGSTQDGAWKAAEHGDDQGTSEEIRIVRNSSRNPFAKRRVNELHFVRWWLGKTPEQLERQRQREMQDQSG